MHSLSFNLTSRECRSRRNDRIYLEFQEYHILVDIVLIQMSNIEHKAEVRTGAKIYGLVEIERCFSYVSAMR